MTHSPALITYIHTLWSEFLAFTLKLKTEVTSKCIVTRNLGSVNIGVMALRCSIDNQELFSVKVGYITEMQCVYFIMLKFRLRVTGCYLYVLVDRMGTSPIVLIDRQHGSYFKHRKLRFQLMNYRFNCHHPV